MCIYRDVLVTHNFPFSPLLEGGKSGKGMKKGRERDGGRERGKLGGEGERIKMYIHE